jgi:hypothetical protein
VAVVDGDQARIPHIEFAADDGVQVEVEQGPNSSGIA